MRKQLITFLITFLLLNLKVSAIEYPLLTEKEILARCYTQLTGLSLDIGDTLWNRLKSERATSICLSLMELAKLDSSGMLMLSNNQGNNLIAKSILKQFVTIHRSWFEKQWAYDATLPDNFWGGVDIYDSQEPALFLTKNLLTNSHYSNVLTGKETAVAIRNPNTIFAEFPENQNQFLRPSRAIHPLDGPIINSKNITYAHPSNPSSQNYELIQTPLIQMGELNGIQTTSYANSPLLPVVWFDAITSETANSGLNEVELPSPFLANKGGGALGSVPYIIYNFGYGFGYKSDGAFKLPRRYILTVFKDFLCRSGPLLRSSDVVPWKSNITESPSFRKSESCLRCHVTLDQAAMVLRNFKIAGTTNGSAGLSDDYRSPPVLVSFKTSSEIVSKEFWPSVSEPKFYKTQPQGVLYFRNIEGEISNFNGIRSLDELGKSFSSTPDYYACAAKRYFEYFTNNKVNLFDPFDDSNKQIVTNMTERENQMKHFVLSMGKELQQKGNLKTVIRRILESDYYRRSNFGR